MTEAVVRELAGEKKISRLVVTERFSAPTYSMSTFHCRKHVEHALQGVGTQIPVVYAHQLGGIDVFNE